MRPISLISHAGKLMEKMALMGLERHVEDNNVLHYCQTGFRRGLSTRDSLTLLAEDLAVGDSVTATWTHGTRKRRSPAREPAAPRSTMRIPDTLLLGVLAFLVGVSADITVSGDLESVGNLAGSPAALFDCNNPDWAPSLSLGYERRGGDLDSARYERQKARRKSGPQPPTSRAPDTAASEITASSSLPSTSLQASTTAGISDEAPDERDAPTASAHALLKDTTTAEFGCQTEMTAASIKGLEQEVRSLHEEVYLLRKKVEEATFTTEAFKEDNEKVNFYTGLPTFIALMAVFNMLEGHVRHTAQNSLGKFEEMMVFLIRLRLHLTIQDIAYRFHVSASTVSRVFEK
ncbi:hypothetical protein ISCGN_007192 [Ixodes scapularis]